MNAYQWFVPIAAVEGVELPYDPRHVPVLMHDARLSRYVEWVCDVIAWNAMEDYDA